MIRAKKYDQSNPFGDSSASPMKRDQIEDDFAESKMFEIMEEEDDAEVQYVKTGQQQKEDV